MPAGDLGFNLGNAILGGDIDREGARLEGLDIGSKIQSRKASTVNALAQARLRVDEAEAKQDLADAVEEMGLPKEAAVHLRAGGTLADLAKGLGGQQERGFRSTIADIDVPFEQRQASAQAIEGKVVDPFQIEGGLFADVFQPGAAPEVAATGRSKINLDEARIKQAKASAALSDERRLHPDRFKASTKAGIDTTVPLADQISPGPGISIVPEGFNPEEAFGAESFFKGGTNRLFDFVGLGNVFEDQAEAENFMNEISARIQIAMREDIYRPNVAIQKLIARYAEDPTQLFRGDDLALQNLNTTTRSLERSLQRTIDQLNSPVKMNKSTTDRLTKQLFFLKDTVADLQAVEQLMQATGGAAPAASGASALGVGETIQIPGGSIKRID